MLWVGLDVHPRETTLCVLDAHGVCRRHERVRGPFAKVVESLTKVKAEWADALEVCFEASNACGYYYDKLSVVARRVVVAHPGHLGLIFGSKRKNDRVDAKKLAMLLQVGAVRAVHVPSSAMRSWRRLIEYRHRLVVKRTRAKNAIRAWLRSVGMTPPRGLWTRRGVAWLAEGELGSEMDAVQRDVLLEELQQAQTQIRRVEKVLNRMASRDSGVQVLRTIPGVGPRTAEAVVAYIDDPHRFRKNRAIGCYFGMVPCQDASAAKNRLGHITREGPATVRGLVTEAAWQAIRRCGPIAAYFERIRRGDPDRKKIALVATAHYLLRMMLAMLRTGEVCRFATAA